MAKGRPGRGQVRRCSVVGWEGRAASADRAARRDCRFRQAKNDGQPSDRMMLVYLIELDDGAIDEETVDPGAFPPTRT
jgi:hypothetical protein